MYLNSLQPKPGSKPPKKRLGRGMGSGLGKTAGKGHKGQRARAGGYHKLGFEGGQMPLQRRLPKFGFTSHKAKFTAEIRLGDLEKLSLDHINLEDLREANLISQQIQKVRIIAAGKISKPVHIAAEFIKVTRGARAAIEAAGGSIAESSAEPSSDASEG